MSKIPFEAYDTRAAYNAALSAMTSSAAFSGALSPVYVATNGTSSSKYAVSTVPGSSSMDLTSDMSGSIVWASGAASYPVTFNLPAFEVGLRYRLITLGDGDMRISASNGGGFIVTPAGQTSLRGYVETGSTYADVEIVAVAETRGMYREVWWFSNTTGTSYGVY